MHLLYFKGVSLKRSRQASKRSSSFINVKGEEGMSGKIVFFKQRNVKGFLAYSEVFID